MSSGNYNQFVPRSVMTGGQFPMNNFGILNFPFVFPFPGMFWRGNGRGRNPNGRGGGRASGNGKVQCQLCRKNGHLVSTCWYRFVPIFQQTQTGSDQQQ